jgi:serpin B
MNPRLYVPFAILTALTLLLSACGGGQVAASRLERVTDPQVPATQMDELVAGNTAFAFDLFQAVRQQEGNLVYSPYSISLAFAMTYAGARDLTAAQMAQVLHISLSDADFHPAFNALDLALAGRPAQSGLPEAERFELSIANSLWGQQDWPFLPEFLDLLAVNYGAGMRLVDFQNATESARRQINDWVSDQTNKRIKDILPPGALDSSTRLALANAIYFKATWEHEFDANDTEQSPFTLLSGDQVNVEMMNLDGTQFAYAAGDGWQAIALPYRGGLTDMIFIVPDLGTYADFEASLTAERYAAIVAALESQTVTLGLPKFTFETSYGLSDTLVGMGMTDAFDPQQADFSGMDGDKDLYISTVLHKAFIAVDEKGTEAAAATVVIMAMSSMPQQGIELTIDRPFFYAIRDVPTGSLLFMGRVLDPR